MMSVINASYQEEAVMGRCIKVEKILLKEQSYNGLKRVCASSA